MSPVQRQAWSRARTIRIAYLVERSEDSNVVLDAIFRKSFSLWGGRFSLIVPCIDGKPEEAYLAWLTKCDPDVIYSYTDLSAECLDDLHERIGPSYLMRHGVRDGGGSNTRYAPELPLNPLEASTVIPLAVSADPFAQQHSIRIVDGWWTHKDAFLLDSFGYYSSHLQRIPPALAPLAALLTVVADEDAQPRSQFIRPPTETIPSTIALLEEMANRKGVKSMSQLASIFCNRVQIEDFKLASSLNLVVGDSFDDRLFYWNARHLYPHWRDGQTVDLRVPSSCLEDERFIGCLRDFLKARNDVSHQGNSSPAVTVRSVSRSEAELEGFCQELRKGQQWVSFSTEKLGSSEAYVPDSRQMEHAYLSPSMRSLGSASKWWGTTSFSGDELRLIPPAPEHLRFAPAAINSPGFGRWAVDIDLERGDDLCKFGDNPKWHLPRRLRVLPAFVPRYQISSPVGDYIVPRVNSHGHISLFTESGAALPSITIPSDHDAVAHGLVRGRDWDPFYRHQREMPSQLCSHVSRSNNGNYFWGVYQLLGGLNRAQQYLGHAFWRDQLTALGAVEKRNDARIDHTVAKVRGRFGHRQLDAGSESDLRDLASLVLKLADEDRARPQSTTWVRLKASHDRLLSAYRAMHPSLERQEDEDAQRMAEESTLARALQDLCARGVMHQGYEHLCRTCHHRSWIAIGELRPVMVCAVCGSAEPAPVDRPWSFHPNDFLRDALRLHGIWPLFWALWKLQSRWSKSFWFDGPMNVFFERSTSPERPDTDIDLTVVSDGLVRMCEVKASARLFTSKVSEQFASTILRLRPDIATIAIMETSTPRIRQAFAAFSEKLAGSGIAPELLTLEEHDFEAWPYL